MRAASNHAWAVVLAAGAGSRLAPLTRRLYGYPLPKQFAELGEGRTLLQQTLTRVGRVIPPARTVVVAAADYASLAREQLSGFAGVELVLQPANRGTGPGALLPLSHVRRRAGRLDVVAIFPSDHHFADDRPLLAAVAEAITAARSSNGLILLGIAAERPETGYGWIEPARADSGHGDLRPVRRFIEKPPAGVAAELLARGALWNTLIVVGRLDAVWRAARIHLAEQARRFDRYDAAGCHSDLAALYRDMPAADLSRDLLQRTDRLAVTRVDGTGWNDWGTPKRVLESLAGSTRAELLARLRRPPLLPARSA